MSLQADGRRLSALRAIFDTDIDVVVEGTPRMAIREKVAKSFDRRSRTRVIPNYFQHFSSVSGERELQTERTGRNGIFLRPSVIELKDVELPSRL